MKRWKDDVEMLEVLKNVIGTTEWLKPEEQNEMIRWVDRQKTIRKLI